MAEVLHAIRDREEVHGEEIVLQVCTCRGGSRGRVQGVRTPPGDDLRFLIQLVFCKKKKRTMWFIGVEVEQDTSAPPPKKNPGSAPDVSIV